MPNREPYSACPDSGPPQLLTLLAGEMLFRIHDERFDAEQFKFARADDPYRGGRFDSAQGDYGYLYAADSAEGCFDEVLLRDEPTNAVGIRTLRRGLLDGRMLSRVHLRRELSVVDLTHTDGLVAVGQDQWLTECQSDNYPHTRAWARAIRSWAPTASGFAWRPRHNREATAYIFFAETDPATSRLDARGALHGGSSQALKEGATRRQLGAWLRRRRCRLS
jgi:hypothetical protein